MRVVLAPDSFKGSLTAAEAVRHFGAGWASVRPGDRLVPVPLADGGEGTTAVAAAHPEAVRHDVTVRGPDDRPVTTLWAQLPDGTAVVDLAGASGLPLMAAPAPLTAHTIGLGELLRAAVTHRSTRRLVVGLGGSASTDGGAGALLGLGARLVDADGADVVGGAALARLERIDVSQATPPPPDGVELLVDVDAPLLGPRGAAAQFGPQKGASPDDVQLLEAALEHFAAVCRVHLPGAPPTDGAGTGATGGTAYGLAALWGARLVPGAPRLADLAGLDAALAGADLVVTGEGRFDAQSLRGKVVGHVLDRATHHSVPVALCVGSLGDDPPEEVDSVVELSELAGGAAAALADPVRWVTEAGRVAASRSARVRRREAGSRRGLA